MHKEIKLTWFEFFSFKKLKNIKSVTLFELLISMMVVAIVVLSFYSLESYGHQQVLSANRRAKVQNSLAYCLEHMSKYVQQANGNVTRKAIQYYPGPSAVGATGFRIYIDLRFPQTPSNPADDSWIDYTLSANTLTATCTANGGACPFTTDNLTDKIIAGVVGDTIMPSSPGNGFYIKIGTSTDTLGTYVDIGLVGRFYPTVATSLATRLTNPQIEMKTKIICNNSSTN